MLEGRDRELTSTKWTMSARTGLRRPGAAPRLDEARRKPVSTAGYAAAVSMVTSASSSLSTSMITTRLVALKNGRMKVKPYST